VESDLYSTLTIKRNSMKIQIDIGLYQINAI
jgi:hypothetical protein